MPGFDNPSKSTKKEAVKFPKGPKPSPSEKLVQTFDDHKYLKDAQINVDSKKLASLMKKGKN